MDVKQTTSIASSLRNMLENCKDLQNLLQSDHKYLIKNDFDLIEENNNKKVDLLNQINTTIYDVNHSTYASPEKTFLENLQEIAQHSDQTTQQELSQLINELKSVIPLCNEHIGSNSRIIVSALETLKTIWEKIAALKTENLVYDNKGSTSST